MLLSVILPRTLPEDPFSPSVHHQHAVKLEDTKGQLYSVAKLFRQIWLLVVVVVYRLLEL